MTTTLPAGVVIPRILSAETARILSCHRAPRRANGAAFPAMPRQGRQTRSISVRRFAILQACLRVRKSRKVLALGEAFERRAVAWRQRRNIFVFSERWNQRAGGILVGSLPPGDRNESQQSLSTA